MNEGTVTFLEPTLYQRGIGIAVGIVLIVLTLQLIQKFHLKEEHGLPWLIGGAVLILLSASMPLLRAFTRALGAGAPATALFAGCIIFLLIQNLLFSRALSRQTHQTQCLAIEVALLREEMHAQLSLNKTETIPNRTEEQRLS
jgi:hypothetical protein